MINRSKADAVADASVVPQIVRRLDRIAGPLCHYASDA